MEYVFMSAADAHRIHSMVTSQFESRPGIRDEGLLESAVNHPRALIDYGDELEREISYLAAAYFFHIIKNHPFADGNKRTGLLVAVEFLYKNGFKLEIRFDDLYSLALDTASSNKTKKEIACLFKDAMRKL